MSLSSRAVESRMPGESKEKTFEQSLEQGREDEKCAICRVLFERPRCHCCGLPGLIRSMPIPRRSHQTESLLRPKKALLLAKGTPLSLRIGRGSPKSLKALSKTVNAKHSLVVSRASQHSR